MTQESTTHEWMTHSWPYKTSHLQRPRVRLFYSAKLQKSDFISPKELPDLLHCIILRAHHSNSHFRFFRFRFRSYSNTHSQKLTFYYIFLNYDTKSTVPMTIKVTWEMPVLTQDTTWACSKKLEMNKVKITQVESISFQLYLE